jgi:death-on-curing protein
MARTSPGRPPCNKRLAWLATYVACAKNGVELDPDDDGAYDLVVAVASGSLDEVDNIAARLRSFVRADAG